MRRASLFQITSIALLCLSMAALTGAQTAKPEQKVTTIVGCLELGNPASAGGERRSEAGAANANDYFVRTPAIAIPPGSTVAVGGARTATSGTSTGRATTSAGDPDSTALYRITGLDREQLRPHIGHRVELQGRLTNDPPSSSGNSTTAKTTVDAAGRATTRVESRMDIAGVLHATAIKMVSESCR
jgi:hypothetical protein